MSDKKYTLGEAAVGFTLAPFLLAILAVVTLPFSLWKSWVLVQLWSWFVVPYFHLPQVSVWLVFGLLNLYGAITFKGDVKGDVKEDEPKTKWGLTLLSYILGPTFSLLIGYLVHHFALHGA